MRKLVLAGLVTAAVCAGSAHAVETNVGGTVVGICEIADLDANLTDFTSLNESSYVEDYSIYIRCNSRDGARIAMTSDNGGLKSVGLNRAVPYLATLRSETAGLDLTLETDSASSVSSDVNGSRALAIGAQDMELYVELKDSALFQGQYTDTIRIDITAN